MRYVFFVNPSAGKGRAAQKLVPAIHAYFSQQAKGPYRVVLTGSNQECRQLAREEAAKGGEARLYACGGDGTLNAVVNGVQGYGNVAVGLFPCGTANDFVRSFGAEKDFLDVQAQICGQDYPIDLIRTETGVAVNQCSAGMDAEVCANKERFQQWPLVQGKSAYLLSLLYCFFSKIRYRFQVSIDGAPPLEGDFLFAVAANGRYCGGGFQSAPGASVRDGKLDCLLVKAVSRAKIISLLGHYTKGTHVQLKDICTFVRASRLEVASQVPAAVNEDGEVRRAEKVCFEVLPLALRFIVPGPCTEREKEAKAKTEKSKQVAAVGIAPEMAGTDKGR